MCRLTVFIFFMSLSAFCKGQVDTIFMSDTNAVMLLFDGKYSGEVGNNDFELTLKESTIKVRAKVKTPVSTFLAVDVINGKKFVFVLAYRTKITQAVYDFTTKAATPSTPKGPIKFSSESPQVQQQVQAKNPITNTANTQNEKGPILSSEEFLRIFELVKEDKSEYSSYAIVEGKLEFKLKSFFSVENYFVFKLNFNNRSSIVFNNGFFDVIIRDKKSLMKKAVRAPNRMRIVAQYPEPDAVAIIAPGNNQDIIIIVENKHFRQSAEIVFKINDVGNNRSMEMQINSDLMSGAKIIQL